jgi:hypothetical protein
LISGLYASSRKAIIQPMRFRIFLDEGLVFIPMAPNKALGNDSKNLKTLTGFSESINSCAKKFLFIRS